MSCHAPVGELSLGGPSPGGDRARLPLRGDLAHIRLAGRCFVPHYAVPLAYRAACAVPLRNLPRATGIEIVGVAAGALFEVLDIAGGWAWGQLAAPDDDGLVGYLPLDALVA